MTKTAIIIAFIIVIAAVAIILTVILFLKRRKKEDKGLTERELIERSISLVRENANKIDVLRTTLDAGGAESRKFDEISEKLKYLTPSAKNEVRILDLRIAAIIDEEINKCGDKEGQIAAVANIDDFVAKIKVCIAERKVITE